MAAAPHLSKFDVVRRNHYYNISSCLLVGLGANFLDKNLYAPYFARAFVCVLVTVTLYTLWDKNTKFLMVDIKNQVQKNSFTNNLTKLNPFDIESDNFVCP